ncbi:hypothetical protein A6A08_12620 [Nocardiopsis sp. TSRI0078]|uniref:hypothetical protein n=1 Tax=unclassified Nocardiopsis TaxID=2649073 RepID=UPI00094054FA|nr:hypothetical protein [Nocardiopsis sp. TSRI0078]OKI14424.1 hypothetical protein A6A08_12620 [Nocardiopsis sp. TSRI0078]
MNTLLTSATVLASDFELDSDTVTPGVLGFLVVFAIGVGLYFLMRSLMGKLRALPKDDDFSAGAGAPADGASAAQASEDASSEDTAPRT